MSMIPGSKILLLGGPGSGKTTAIKTLLDADLEVFCVVTEPMGIEILSDTDPERLHWKYIPAAAPAFSSLLKTAELVNATSFEGLTQMKMGIEKKAYSQFTDVLRALDDFTDDRTGRKFGAVDTWDNTRAIVIDSLSGLSIMAMDLVVGAKPVKAMGEWGVAMDTLERLVNKLCTINAFFVLTAHLEREVDEIAQSVRVMSSTLGKKLAPKLPRFFSDVVLCQRDEKGWSWSTNNASADLKTRNLAYGDRLPPTFVPLIQAWKQRNAKGTASAAAASVAAN